MHPFVSRSISPRELNIEQRREEMKFLKHKLIKVKMEDEKNYPYFRDGTSYYIHPVTSKIYRFTADRVYEALGNGEFREIEDITLDGYV